ncbi:hypothetical protein [Chloroflexus sp.]|uniref:hypothetical protein n=1 Tax=Chloroflexus sp. TaxID=1904827 RepID=UPI00404A329F
MMLHRRLLELIAEVRSNVVLMVLLGLLIAGTYIGQGLLIAQVVLRMFERADWASVLPLIGWALAFVVVRAVLLWSNS